MTDDPDIIPKICQRVRQVRIEYAGDRGKARFSRELDISASTYDYYENGRVPPAELLVRISQVAGVDLRWLLTGRAGSDTMPIEPTAVTRAARLLSDRPDAAAPLAAFLDLLTEATTKFPPAQQPDLEARQTTPGRRPDAPTIAMRTATAPSDRSGWIPILGRTAAGVPRFWGDDDDADGATTLADLVGPIPSAPPCRVMRASSEGDLAGVEEAVQLVQLDTPRHPGTAEFVVTDRLAAEHPSAFAVRVDGHSMAPDIRHGDIVVLSPDCVAEQGKPAVVQLAGQIGVTCKLFRIDTGRVHLIPINDRYEPATYPDEGLQWALKVLARIRPA